MEHLWRSGDDAVGDQLAEVLLAGPPEYLDNGEADPDNRQAFRDRRLFNHLGLLARNEAAPLLPSLQALQDEILQRHPEWRLQEGEQARFAVWSEVRHGPDTRHSLEDLRAIGDPDLINLLCEETDRRDGLLEIWRQLAALEPARAIRLLSILQGRVGGGPADVWLPGLRGLRDAFKSQDFQDRLVNILNALPDALFREIARAVADLLEAGSTKFERIPTMDYWRLFDRALAAAEADPENAEAPEDSEWVERAFNRSLGAPGDRDAKRSFRLSSKGRRRHSASTGSSALGTLKTGWRG
jgi:hypothetical protein